MFTGMQETYLPMHVNGIMGVPRRGYTYLPRIEWDWANLISTAGPSC